MLWNDKYLRTLKSYVRNKSRPKGSIVEGYIAEKCTTFCSRYLHDVETKHDREERNYVIENNITVGRSESWPHPSTPLVFAVGAWVNAL